MTPAVFRFYEELNDFLAPARRKRSFEHPVDRRASVKDMIESFGVPHTEVDLILVDGESVDFSHIVRAGQRISVYPMFEAFDVAPLQRLRPRPLRRTRFVVDVNLGRLARYLRLLGFDTLYRNDYEDRELARVSARSGRILLTRDRGLLKHSAVTHGVFVRATAPRDQLREVVTRLSLHGAVKPLHRCSRCNGLVNAVPKESVLAQLAPGTRRHHQDFWQCRACGQAYWKGSHYQRVRRLVEQAMAPPAGSGK